MRMWEIREGYERDDYGYRRGKYLYASNEKKSPVYENKLVPLFCNVRNKSLLCIKICNYVSK